MHKLNLKHFVLTTTSFVFIVYAICAALTFAAPTTLLALANQWAHGLDFTTIVKTPTLPNVIIGAITISIATALLSSLFVFVWNWFYKRTEE